MKFSENKTLVNISEITVILREEMILLILEKIAKATYTFETDNNVIACYLYLAIRDLFHVYLNKFEFHILRLHINKTNKLCFFMHNRRVPGSVK